MHCVMFQVVKYTDNLARFLAQKPGKIYTKGKGTKEIKLHRQIDVRTHCGELTSGHTKQFFFAKSFEGGGKRLTSKSSNQRYQRQHSAYPMLFDTRALEFVQGLFLLRA